MSKLDDILDTGEESTINFETKQKAEVKALIVELVRQEFVHGESSTAFDEGRKYEQFRIAQEIKAL